jgi:hypothetical protein
MDKSQKNQPRKRQDENDSKPRAAPTQSEPSVPEFRSGAIPEFRSMAMSVPRPMSVAGPATRNPDVIDKESYFNLAFSKPQASKPEPARKLSDDTESNWAPTELRPVPAFYPLERSSRVVDNELSEVVARVSEANRVLSIHAIYCNETATASLLTAENVEMQLSLWKTEGGIAAELQRRKGDSIAFHRYSRYLLDAVVGDFDPSEHVEKHGEQLDVIYSKKIQRLLSLETGKEPATELENAIIAIEIAHGLLMKDRMDARQLGLESLCLLTDPNKTGSTTALIASRVVLLGTAQDLGSEQEDDLIFDEAPFQEIRQTILSLIQLRRIGDADEFDTGLSEEEEHITTLHNLALAVLANALDVIENEDDDEDLTRMPRARTASETICENFLSDATEVSGDNEIIKTLITELGKAGDKPHNACLSAKCIGSLCRASDKARRRAKELGAKTVVQTALEVGTRTHLKLEKECEKVITTLTTQTENE